AAVAEYRSGVRIGKCSVQVPGVDIQSDVIAQAATDLPEGIFDGLIAHQYLKIMSFREKLIVGQGIGPSPLVAVLPVFTKAIVNVWLPVFKGGEAEISGVIIEIVDPETGLGSQSVNDLPFCVYVTQDAVGRVIVVLIP